MTVILGAGMAGLLAAALDRKAQVYEASPTLPNNHRAVLRFREDKIARALNIPFRRVRVLKGVADSRGAVRDANDYSRKVSGRISARSIASLEPVDRWIAPPDFIAQLADLSPGRINLGTLIDGEHLAGWRDQRVPVISTIPLPTMLRLLGEEVAGQDFQFSAITVLKYEVASCDAFQTIYFPAPTTPIYRASLTGNELLIESMLTPSLVEIADAMEQFGLSFNDTIPVSTDRQTLGKIVPLLDSRRKALLLALSTERQIFSLGRYACWRNILLDDVFEDYYRVKRLIEMDSAYDFRRSHA